MATNPNLMDEVLKLRKELEEKEALLQKQQAEQIEKVLNDFIATITKNNFNKVTVKKLLIEKLTKKHSKK